MALQAFDNKYGTLISPYPNVPVGINTANQTLDAAGESFAAVGHILLSSGPGTSKTLSTGKIYFRPTGTVTFADAGTTIRIGLQDVGAAGLEDGTHDVYGELVGGTDTITTAVVNSVTMSSGTKTVTHGDQIAVVIEMTARAGSDSVIIIYNSLGSITPHVTRDTGSGPTLTAGQPYISIEFDDGTLGWFGLTAFANITESIAAFNSGSTPDEYALVFRLPFKAAALGLFGSFSNLAASEDFEMILYSDPLGTPVAERTLTQDMSLYAVSTGFDRPFTSTYTLEANTDYAIAYRPTTGGSASFQRLNFNTGNGVLRKATMLGTNWSQYSRTNQTGAFDSQDITKLPLFGVWVGQLDDGAGGGAETSTWW